MRSWAAGVQLERSIAAKRPWTSSRSLSPGRTSRAGMMETESVSPVERWLSGSKRRMLSISFPQSSIRTGCAESTGKMSMMPPRLLTQPGACTPASNW